MEQLLCRPLWAGTGAIQSMQVKQKPDELSFYVIVDCSDEYSENVQHIRQTFGKATTPAQRQKCERVITEYRLKFVNESAGVCHARQIDPEVQIELQTGLVAVVTFSTRSAAALFKLSYC
jgi:hypothetical protein